MASLSILTVPKGPGRSFHTKSFLQPFQTSLESSSPSVGNIRIGFTQPGLRRNTLGQQGLSSCDPHTKDLPTKGLPGRTVHPEGPAERGLQALS